MPLSFGTMRSAARALLLWYARHLPYHRGKERFSGWLRDVFQVSLKGEFVERREGLWWALDAEDYVQADLFWASAKDAVEIREVLRCMPKGGVMFDLGANFGYYAIRTATALHSDCRVYAFEPNPPTMRRFRQNLDLNSTGGVYPREEGVSDVTGSATVLEERGNSGAAYLDPAVATPGGIPLTTLDLFCEQHRIDRLDVIKMDIEGGELRALRGGAGALRRFMPVILIELNSAALERQGCSVRDVVVFLEDLGYAICAVRSRNAITRSQLPGPRGIVNAICRARRRDRGYA